MMIRNQLASGSQTQSPQSHRFQRDVPRAQLIIYDFLLDIVKHWEPDVVLEEFKSLFIHHVSTISSDTLPALYEILFSNQEQEFRNTLKRSCYILINNWDLSRNHKSIQQLVQLFKDPIIYKPTLSPTLRRLRTWLRDFIDSQDFEELQLFAARYDERDKFHWADHYTSYLLVSQYTDLKNPIEQRQAARALSKQLKEKFKFELAMYTAHSQSNTSINRLPKNPTALGDEVLRLIKMIIARRGLFGYTNLANIFIRQTQNLTYRNFKTSLQEYLIFSVGNADFAVTLKNQLSDKLETLYTNHNDKSINDALLLRTANRVIEYLTTENHEEPSPLFIMLLSAGNPLILVIVLLKLILVCRYARTHLEARIADLIRYYKDVPENECQWVIRFFEIFNITMTIYAENVEYSLVDMTRQYSGRDGNAVARFEQKPEQDRRGEVYRIFSQFKGNIRDHHELEAFELKALEVLSDEDEAPEIELID